MAARCHKWKYMPFVAMVLISALPDAGDFMKRVSVQPAGMSAFNFSEPSLSTQRSHSRCEVRDYVIAVHQKIRPFILYVWTLSEPLNNLYLLGKLTERQGRKVTDLRETMAAGLRHGCSSVCINCLPLRCLKIWKGERYVWPHSWFLFYPIGHAPVPWVCIRWIGRCGTYSTVRGRFFCTQSGYINDSTRALRR